VKIIMVSAYGQHQDACLRLGAYDYIKKPCRPSVLLDAAKKVEALTQDPGREAKQENRYEYVKEEVP